jgi:DNA-binding CsgD family transcriptional regulator
MKMIINNSDLSDVYPTNAINWEINIKITLAGLLATTSFLSMDILADYIGWYNFSHLLLEMLAIGSLISLMIYLLFISFKAKMVAQAMEDRLTLAEEGASQWESKLINLKKGLRNLIDQQFESWHFTQAESEIGLMMLKGLSFKEIAALRNVSERTVRQQASGIYRKSETASRNEFSAFFLEDLLLPLEDNEPLVFER